MMIIVFGAGGDSGKSWRPKIAVHSVLVPAGLAWLCVGYLPIGPNHSTKRRWMAPMDSRGLMVEQQHEEEEEAKKCCFGSDRLE